MPWVWFCIAGLILLMAAGALYSLMLPPDLKGDQVKVFHAMRKAEKAWGIFGWGPSKEEGQKIIDELKALPIRDPAAKSTLARGILIIQQDVDPDALPSFGGMTEIADPLGDAITLDAVTPEDVAAINEALRELYSSEELTVEDADRLWETLAAYESYWPMDLALDRINAIAHDAPQVEAELTAHETKVGLMVLAFLALGVGALVLFAFKGKPLGLPVEGIRATGDSLGARFLIFLVLFTGGGIGAAVFIELDLLPSEVALLGLEIALIVAMLAVIVLPIGRSLSLKEFGLRSDSLGKDLLYGFVAYLANFPVVLLLTVVGIFAMDWIPSGSHPVETEIMHAANPWLLVLTVGPITGILEEITFRGMFFQGLALRWRLWPAIIVSSLGFAMIHPQGGHLWLALAYIGGVAAYLTYQRKSLIPAIVMHSLHNSTLVLFSFYVT